MVFNLPFFRKSENFLILELSLDKTTAVLLRLGADQKLTIEDVVEDPSPARLSGFPAMRHSRLARERRARDRVIVSADSSLVHTAIIPIQFVRENHREPLAAVELENLLAQGVARTFGACRAEAGRELGVDELDIILAGSQVVSFKIDGHRVLNPVGFTPRTIEAILELTLTTRGAFVRLAGLFRARRRFYFTERGRAVLSCLEKVSGLPARFLDLGPSASRFFTMDRAAVGYLIRRGILDFPADAFISAISRDLGTEERASRDAYVSYLADRLSPSARRYFAKLFSPGIKELFAKLRAARGKGEVFIHAHRPLPTALPLKEGSITLLDLPFQKLLDRVGLEYVLPTMEYYPGPAFVRLAPFFEFYSLRHDSPLNAWLRRHLQWLGGTS